MDREKIWWKTFDYKSGKSYILGEKFNSKSAAMNYAKQCGMIVIPQSTRSITDDQRRIAILENQIKKMQLNK